MAEIFNGKFIVAPSTNVYVDTSNLANLNTGGSKTLAIIATGTAGVPKTPFQILDPGTAKKILRSGDLLEAALVAFDPSNATGGATTIYGVRVNSAVQAKSRVLDINNPIIATGTATVSGTIGSGNSFTLTIAGVAFTYVASGSDTPTSVASSIVTLVNSSTSSVITDGIGGVTASNVAGVITITAKSAGIDSNSITLAASETGGTATFTTSGATLTGGTGNTLFTLVSDDYGQYCNQIYYRFDNASSNGIKTTIGLTTVGNLNGGVVVQDNIYRPLFSIQYTGAGSACTLTVNDSTLTTNCTGATGDNLNISFASYGSIQQVVDYISATGKYSVALSQPASGTYASAGQFDSRSALDIKTSAVTLNGTLEAVIDWFNNTAPYVKATRTTNPASATPVIGSKYYLKGGSDGTTTTSDWVDAINSLQAQDCQIVVPISNDAAVHAAVSTHVQYMSEQSGKRRIAICGGALNEYSASSPVPTQAISSRAISLNSSRVGLVSPGLKIYDSHNNLVLKDSSFSAAFVGGMFAAVTSGTPLTHKLMSNVYGLETNYTPADIDALIQTGVMPIQFIANKGYWIVQSVTTWNGAPNFADNEMSVVLEIDQVVEMLQSTLDTQLIGRTVSPVTLAQACSITETVLIDATNSGYIVGDSKNPSFKNIAATANGDQIGVSFQMSPAIPANYVNISISTNPYSGSVTVASRG